jgi:hypothetical protein
MIIKYLKIDGDADVILGEVATNDGNGVQAMYAWNSETYKDDAKKIDVSSRLSGNTSLENFTIRAEDLGVNYISGVWAFEFVPTNDTETPVSGTVANFIPYNECILARALECVVKGCAIQDDDCGNRSVLLQASTLLDTLKTALLFGLVEEAIQIQKVLEDLCEICTNCPDYNPSLYYEGFGVKVVAGKPVTT